MHVMSTTCRVLLVDDSVELRTMLRVVLDADPSIQVIAEAADGRRAIELAAQERPDVVVLDIAMPVMDGLTALPAICAASPNSAVVVLSGLTDEALRDRARDLGAHAFVQKGTAMFELREIVRSAHAAGAYDEAPVPA